MAWCGVCGKCYEVYTDMRPANLCYQCEVALADHKMQIINQGAFTDMKKKNKPDPTTRNLKAAKKREASLKERVKGLEVQVRAHERDISWILAHLAKAGQ